MYLDIKYDITDFAGVTIRPGENENPDCLHNYANTLMVKNIAVTFSEMAKDGKFNDMNDDDYDRALQNVKIVSSFFNNQPEANVFHVLAEAVKYILSQKKDKEEPEKADAGSDNPFEDFAEEDFMDEYIGEEFLEDEDEDDVDDEYDEDEDED